MKKMKKMLKKNLTPFLRKSYTFRSFHDACRLLKRKQRYKRLYHRIPTQDKLVIFEAFFAKKYACSPKAIYEYMLQAPEYRDFEFVWAFRNPSQHAHLLTNGRTSLVKYRTEEYLKYYCKAKYWVTNSRLPEEIIRKEDQRYIQCWHGTPLKRLGYDIQGPGKNPLSSARKVRKQYRADAHRYSYMLSPSPFCTEKFTSAFHLQELHPDRSILIEQGYPRNDFLSKHTAEDVKSIKEKLNLPDNKKILLYAPTWRDNQHVPGTGYTLDLRLDLEKLQQQLGAEYILLLRLHYLIANQISLDGFEDFVYNVSGYDDINDLYVISDILITDYSSVFFDFGILKRPMIFYMYDLDEYKNEIRDFYIDLDELPGPIVETQERLSEEIRNIETYRSRYQSAYEKFNQKFNALEDGKAAERVVKTIMGHQA